MGWIKQGKTEENHTCNLPQGLQKSHVGWEWECDSCKKVWVVKAGVRGRWGQNFFFKEKVRALGDPPPKNPPIPPKGPGGVAKAK